MKHSKVEGADVYDLDVTGTTRSNGSPVDVQPGEIVQYSGTDPALAAQMQMVNDAINQLGFTPYHLKLFFLNGFGYAVDSLLAFLYSITASQVDLEFNPPYTRGGQIGLYVGLLAGALFWGIGADLIGRKWAFNLSLLIASIFTLCGGAAPSYNSWSAFVALAGFGAGGNLVLDTTVFLEYLPKDKQWLVTLMALWWGVGQTIAGLFAWAFIPNFSCDDIATCTKANNYGWRYLFFTAGAFVFALSIARVTIIRFHETPKYLLGKGKYEELVSLLTSLAKKHGRRCDLTVEGLQSFGITHTPSKKISSAAEIISHYRGLFATKKLGCSTMMVWLSWTMVGLAYPLFYVFLPTYLASRGAEFGVESAYITWRNYVIAQVCAIFGPVIAAYLCRIKNFGRKYTMVFGALLSMAFFFAYTAVRNEAQNVGFNCAISVTINIYYGSLYAYSPEVMPSAHRATGNGTAVAFNRIMGIISAVVATYADTTTAVPIYVCAALFGAMAIVSALFPLEPEHSQSS